MSKYLFSVDIDELERLAGSLDQSFDLEHDQRMVDGLNTIVDAVYATARARMIAGINLTDDYVKGKMEVSYASTNGGLSAQILAPGGPNYQTPLGRYLVGEVTKPSRTGQGTVRAGVEVAVGKGRNVTLMNAWVMPLKRGEQNSGNGLGVFLRTKYGLIKHRYGPAPYQLFRVAAADLEGAVGETLAERMGNLAHELLQEALSK